MARSSEIEIVPLRIGRPKRRISNEGAKIVYPVEGFAQPELWFFSKSRV